MAIVNGDPLLHSNERKSFIRRSSIPHLFPERLIDISVQKVMELLLRSGEILESHGETLGSGHSGEVVPKEYFYSEKLRKYTGSRRLGPYQKKKRIESFRGERRYLATALVSDVMDILADASRRAISCKGFQFLFMVLCNERTKRFVIHSSDQESNEMQKFWSSDPGTSLAVKGLSRLVNLQSLVLQKICTDPMIFIIAEHCQQLVLLDVSYSERVTGIGLLGLCGFNNSPGCKYLRDLIFKHGEHCDNFPPKIIACLLRYMENLEVLDIQNLHEGIQYYYKGQGGGHYHPKPERIRPLNLKHYTGSEKLLEVIDICPKLRTLKLEASERLPYLGSILARRAMILEHITLSWGDTDNSNTLSGLKGFLKECGDCIGKLELVTPTVHFRSEDFFDIGVHCPLLENLIISHLRMETQEDGSAHQSLSEHSIHLFPYLSMLKIQKIDAEPDDPIRNTLKDIILHSPELEKLNLSFKQNAYFFSDFFLEEILRFNSLSHLREFIVMKCSLTLISALKLVSSRPKLSLMGNVFEWDVEPSELETFAHILRKAKALNLLQDITIV
eukprot:TRINITY_DN5149_c0_g1_i1.p1 TRINITY_DN5149_c0_g1~~TRINITY_DN5149_c0_g1_i1.p1  ORF type:complete len:559 (-),score=92.53 TRINITY_DN5149_c0_g1_i1:63-1739(-)